MWGEALGPRPEEGQLRYSIICTGFFFFSRSQLLSQDWSTFSSEVSRLATIAAAEDFNPSAAFPSTSTITFSLWFNIINQDHFTRITVPGRNIDVQRVSSLVLAQVPHVTRGKPGKSITGSGWNKKTAPAEKDRVNEGVQVLPHLRLHPHHVSAFIGGLPSSEDDR